MIITKLNGGLGNQLFEYAYARNLQLMYQDELYLDAEGFARSPRHYSLDAFFLSDDVKILPKSSCRKLVFLQAISRFSRNTAFFLGRLFNVYMWKSSVYREIQVGDTKKQKAYFYGYWQSEKYFLENAGIIKDELKVKVPVLKESKPYLQMAAEAHSVCVHIRRGDYVTCNMIACDENYYLQGMRYIRQRFNKCRFLVFTDDIQWVKENIHFEYPVVFVEISDPDYEVLRIMYSCKHFVMSNSSFSWWAQYLSDNPEKIVIAPHVWYPNSKKEVGIYQDNWVVL